MTETEIVVVDDRDAAAGEAASRIASALAGAVQARGRADWATTGGSTPIGIYRRLVASPLRDAVPWDAVHVWWGDDRHVPFDHPLSNVKPFDDILLGLAAAEEGTAGATRGVPIPRRNIHPFPIPAAIAGGHGPAWSAATLAADLRAAELPDDGGWPALDLVILGIGPDGHILSVFPGSAAFDATELALAIPAPSHIEPQVERVTLNPALVTAARRVIVVARGAAKAPVIGRIFGSEVDPRRWPAQLARRAGATWILDSDAATQLPS